MPSGAAKLEQSVIKSSHTKPVSGQDFEQLNVQHCQFERLKLDENDQDDRSPVQTPTSTDPGENHFGKSVLYTKILVNMYKYYYRATIR